MTDSFNILIVGLGIMGGSLAKALKGFKSANIFAVDKRADVIQKAKDAGEISDGANSAERFLPICDLVIICLYPKHTVDFINSGKFKKGAVVTDICGVKQFVLEHIKNDNVVFLGGHPMAGRELSGYEASVKNLFLGASYILTPQKNTPTFAVSLLTEMAKYIGCRSVKITTPEKHDEMIAYTSQLMHVVAAALCDNPLLAEATDFSAGSLRDCTRVANLNAVMWSELFCENKHELIKRINEFESGMDTVKAYLSADDTDGLCKFLEAAASRKRSFFN